MMKIRLFLLLLITITISCRQQPKNVISPWIPYDETEEILANASHKSPNMRFKLIQSRIMDKNDLWKSISGQISNFSEEDYQKLKLFIFNQDIPTIQSHIKAGLLTYETLTKWYLYRIVKYENDKEKYLNAIISINPDAVSDARQCDKKRSKSDHPIYGMPILIKDNIGMEGLPTTAGAVVLLNNNTANAFIVDRIKEKGGIILGKTNLSEWANFFSARCPNGYSAVGGQTLNSYGRKIFDSGGSSSGSGSAMAVNYAAASIGTETSGSILSPSSKNSLVGLKPTVGLLSRSGIVPISGTLDTPGPITRNVIDNAILLSAMSGEDIQDETTKDNPENMNYWENLRSGTLRGIRFGVNKNFLNDSIYKLSIGKIVSQGGIVFEFEPKTLNFDDFSNFLKFEMMIDLPNYLNKYAPKEFPFRSILEIVNYNKQDSINRIPYGQTRFEGMLDGSTMSPEDLNQIRIRLHDDCVNFFEQILNENELDAILSIDNRNAGYAAAAKYPCLTIPMGYRANGEPCGLTFIARPFEEEKLLKLGYAFENETKMRKTPVNYE